MKMCCVLQSSPSSDWKLARQVGVEGAVFGLIGHYLKDPSIVSYRGIKGLMDQLADVGLDLTVIEGDPVPLEQTRRGLPGRDKEIDLYLDVIKVLGDLGIRVMCPNFMAGINWVRTEVALPIRGGALTTAFRASDLAPQTVDLGGAELTEEKLWDNLYFYYDRVLPVAEGSGVKLGMHPDDPPISPVHNVPRILTSPDAYRRLFAAFPSDSNGMTFCQANFMLMGGDIYDLAEEFGRMGKIFFVHFRDVKGTARDFEETFHDDGPTDMARMMEIYLKYCPDAPIRPDHVPTLEGDDNVNYGYTMRGRLFAIGYIKGLIDGLKRETRNAKRPLLSGLSG
ncbi:MAG TPA: mannonate dehydratase [Rhodothermales bacterium]|nr:mannonate dehydratase [Rhodothermales bacterium]